MTVALKKRSTEPIKEIPAWVTRDWMVMVGLGVGTILSRWPFQVGLFNNFDAINYALALERFDMSLSQPQPPGYPLYILLGRMFNLVFQDDRLALLWLSTLFSGLAVIALYLAGRELFGRRTGFIAALMLATSAVFWYMGEIAAPYTLDLFAAAITGWLCYRTLTTSGNRFVWLSALALGLTGALRVQTLVFLFPLFLYALHKRPWKVTLSVLGIAGALLLIFLIPAIYASGGPEAFKRQMIQILPIFRDTETLIRTTRWFRFMGNIEIIGQYTWRALGELVFPFVLVGYLAQGHPLRFWSSQRLLFLCIWLLPVWIIYFLIWPGNLGTILVSLPPLFLLAGAGLDWVIGRGRSGFYLGTISLVALLAWNIVVFSVLPVRPFGKAYRTFDNNASLRESTQYYEAKLSLIKEIPVEGTIIYAQDFRHPQYYLPQYQTYSYPTFQKENPEIVRQVLTMQNRETNTWRNVNNSVLAPAGTKRIVFFDLPKWLTIDNEIELEERSIGGYSIQLLSIPAEKQVVWTADGLAFASQAGLRSDG